MNLPSFANVFNTISSIVDSSLQELVKRILPLCSNYSIVVRFIEGNGLFACA